VNKLTIDDIELAGKRVLTRVDFNVPLDGGKVADDTRITASIPTIQKLVTSGGKAVLMSHLGRPKGEVKPEFSLEPVAKRLSQLMGRQVIFANDCIGGEIEKQHYPPGKPEIPYRGGEKRSRIRQGAGRIGRRLRK
jgi:phosphoglycerate kinase